MKAQLTALTVALILSFGLSSLAGEPCNKPVQDCLNSMVIELKSTGFIGVELDKGKKGKEEKLVVKKVIPGSPAEKVGIQVGDELYSIEGLRFTKANWKKIGKVKKPGAKVTCIIKRNGANKELAITLVPMPADLMAKYIGEHMMMHAKADQEKKVAAPGADAGPKTKSDK